MNWINIITTLITSTTSIIVALIAAGFFKTLFEKNREKKTQGKLLKQIQQDEVIHFTLKELRRKYNADRINIMQFHNGGMFYTQAPMQKLSITFERCSDGLERMFERFQNVFVSHHTWYISETINMSMFFTNIEEDVRDLPTRSLFKSFGNYALCSVPIYDLNNNLIALFSLSWVFSEIPSEILNDDKFDDLFKKTLFDEANSLKTYLLT
jgi:hypothetical protein